MIRLKKFSVFRLFQINFKIKKEMCFSEPNDCGLKKSPKRILKSFTLAYYYTDSILGEEDVLLNSKRENSLVCSSNVGNILVLSKTVK